MVSVVVANSIGSLSHQGTHSDPKRNQANDAALDVAVTPTRPGGNREIARLRKRRRDGGYAE